MALLLSCFSPRLLQFSALHLKPMELTARLSSAIVQTGFTKDVVSDKCCLAQTEYEEKKSLELPVNCCMSGCVNCVWIQYAEELARHCCSGGVSAQKVIEENVQDPCLRAFLLMELRQYSKEHAN